ncbi:Transposase [Mycoavidus cysteinexigens]|uniref:Transposase n=1 Tax=Mycoavidus cysteinexigens TaxID=1553431 RepID=A0A2Z6EV83_9BURK|nr:Transposase [Mycoavidus cysteinexigens]
MDKVALIGIDLGKTSFHLHGQDKAGRMMFRKKSQLTLSALHRVREALIKDRTSTINQIHGFLLEFGVSLPVGHAVIKRLPALLAEHPLPPRFDVAPFSRTVKGFHKSIGNRDEIVL